MARSGSPPQRRASGRTPSLHRLRTIALHLVGRSRNLALGLEIDDLVAAGWLGYVTAADARTASYPYQRARFAMIDHLRGWYGATTRDRPTWCAMPDMIADDPEEPPRLTVEQADDVRAACARLLSPRSAELMVGLLVDGDSIELIAERQGRTRQAAAIARSQAIARLRSALAA